MMLPCCDHIDNNSSSGCHSKDTDKKKKNGFHKSPSSDSIETLESKGNKLIRILEKDPKNLEAVSRFVQNHKDTVIQWENSDYSLRLCDLSGTIYMGQKFMQESWEELYLPKPTRMQVFGTLENLFVLPPSVQRIILVGEDGCVYAYGEEELQLVAKSLREFKENGINNIYQTYKFPDDSDEEDESLQQDEEILKIRQSTKDFVNKSAKEFDDFLNFLST